MRTLLLVSLAVMAFGASAVASAAPTAATNAPLIIAMRDPGCHWFYLGGGPSHRKYASSVVRSGPVTLLNLDEAALIVKGPGGTKIQPVGKKLLLEAKGVYRITMVKQAPDDNHLVLKIT